MPITFTKACHDYFGRKPDQSLGEFQQELKALDDENRAYFKREFLKIGIEIQ